MAEKRIIVSKHAAQRMVERGATPAEVEHVIRSRPCQPAKGTKWHARERLLFRRPSPINGNNYEFKTLDVVFADHPNTIVVVTVKVFYHD